MNNEPLVQLGSLVEEFEIPYLHPFHTHYPAWPGGERWLQWYKSTWGTNIIITRGLSNPGKGFEFEAYLETTDVITDFGSSWQANIVYEIGSIIPNVPDLEKRLTAVTYMSVQSHMSDFPEGWSIDDPKGNVGLFVGLQNPRLHAALKQFTPLNVKLLRAEELKYIISNGQKGRMELAELFKKESMPTASSINRKPVV